MEFIELPTESLHEWETNQRLRAITEENFLKLKDKLTLKPQFKPLIVTPDGDGSYSVLAGNHRLKAYRELGVQKLWVSIVEFAEDERGWYAIKDGISTPERFQTKQDALLDWSLVDNEESAYYDRDMFVNEMDTYNLDWSTYSIDFNSPLSIPDELAKFGINEQTDEDTDATPDNPTYTVVIDCQNEIEQKEFFDKLQTLGIPARMNTK